MNIYPTSSTSQSPLNLKRNWTFKIAIQIIHQRECRKIYESKQSRNKAAKAFLALLQSIVPRQQPIVLVQLFIKSVFCNNQLQCCNN